MVNRSRRIASIRSRWVAFALAAGTIAALVPLGAFGVAANLENHDSFCASCHTQPESEYVTRSTVPPVDLASSHAAHGVGCIQCHSGPGVTGRIGAMVRVALPDLIAYRSGHYTAPATLTTSIGDSNCLKCHPDLTRRRDFDNHFHAFLPLWQAQDRAGAATCVSCHLGHTTRGEARLGYLVRATAEAVCERCHRAVG